MPKMRVRAKGASRASAIVIRSKFRIGSRKGGKSALFMSTEDLQKVLADNKKSKFHPNARHVLNLRP